MTIAADTLSRRIQAARVPTGERLMVLARHFGSHVLVFESAVYLFARQFCEGYSGGYWHFHELDNGGFYMSPQGSNFTVRVPSNGYEGQMSAEAAGITLCLFTFSHLSFRFPVPAFIQHFHSLREFALEHTDAGKILAAID